jgi:hypothetical protein
MSFTNRSRFVTNPSFLTGGGGGSAGNVSITFEAEGFEETINAMKQMGDALIENVYASMVEVMSEAAAIARADAPVDTGNLRANIFSEPVSKTDVRMHSMAPYSGYVNYGHKTRGNTFVPPQPFFSQAIEYVKTNFPQTLKLNVKRF